MSAVYELSCAPPHQREDDRRGGVEWIAYRDGYYLALVMALRVMLDARERWTLRQKERRRQQREARGAAARSAEVVQQDGRELVRMRANHVTERQRQRRQRVSWHAEAVTLLGDVVGTNDRHELRLGFAFDAPAHGGDGGGLGHNPEYRSEIETPQPEKDKQTIRPDAGGELELEAPRPDRESGTP